MEGIFGFADILDASLGAAQDRNIELSRAALNTDFGSAARLAFGTLGSQLSYNSCITELTPNGHHILGLAAAAVRSRQAIEKTLLQANYLQASVLLRQTIEGQFLARALRENRWRSGEKGNPKDFQPFKRLYGLLSELAHLSKRNRLYSAMGGLPLPLEPCVDKPFLNYLYGAHIASMVGHAVELGALLAPFRGVFLTPTEDDALKIALGVLVEHDIFRMRPGNT